MMDEGTLCWTSLLFCLSVHVEQALIRNGRCDFVNGYVLVVYEFLCEIFRKITHFGARFVFVGFRNDSINAKTTILMKSFIADYLQDPTLAIADAQVESTSRMWFDEIDEDEIYRQLASPEFRLYEEIILSPDLEEAPRANSFSVVA